MQKKCVGCEVQLTHENISDEDMKICWDCYDHSYEGQKNSKDYEGDIPFIVKVTYTDSLECQVMGFSQESVIEYVEGKDWNPELFVRTSTTEVHYDGQKVYERMEVLN